MRQEPRTLNLEPRTLSSELWPAPLCLGASGKRGSVRLWARTRPSALRRALAGRGAWGGAERSYGREVLVAGDATARSWRPAGEYFLIAQLPAQGILHRPVTQTVGWRIWGMAADGG